MRNWNGSDRPEVWLRFLDGSMVAIDSTPELSNATSEWRLKQDVRDVPVGTRFVEYVMAGTRNSGTDNDSYVDDAFLRLGVGLDPGDQPCREMDCLNGLDDDGDGATDCEDPDCLDADTDGDAVSDCFDCAPLDGGVFDVAPEVALLLAINHGGNVELVWTDVSPDAGRDTAYDVFTGTIAELHRDGDVRSASCLANDRDRSMLLDERPVPEASDGYWYLVRGDNSCGAGPIGPVPGMTPGLCD
jgi:hypothetical protein